MLCLLLTMSQSQQSTMNLTSCSSTSITLFPSQTNVSPQTQSPHNCSTPCSLSDYNPATPVSPSAMLEESHREALHSERGGVVQKTKLFTTVTCRSVILCAQYIDVHPPSFKFFSLLCAPPIPCLFLLPPTSFLLPSSTSFILPTSL